MLFETAHNLSWRSVQIGDERSPVLIIDDLVADPHALVEAASGADFIDVGPVFPGVRAPAPDGYGQWVLDVLRGQIKDHFNGAADWGFDLIAYSMVTTPPRDLNPLQCLPHFDGDEPSRLAFLHYLCDARHGGTSFYRQKSTRFERIHPERMDEYLDHLEQDRAVFQPQNRSYTVGDTPLFERIGSVEAKFNRAVLYPGSLLHSGDIIAPDLLSETVQTGRLTINGFVVLDQA